MFHVERHPIDIAAPVFGAPRNKIVNIGIDNLQRQGLCQRSRGASLFTISVNFQPGSAISDPDRYRTGAGIRLPNDQELVRTMPDQIPGVGATKGPTPTEVSYGFENAGFSRRIRTKNKVVPNAKLEGRILQAPEVRAFDA